VCNKDVQVKHFKNLEPLWILEENIKLVVVCPLLQYIAGSCCEDTDHIPNRGNQNYESKLRSDLEALKNNLKMYFHTGGHHHCRVMDLLVDLKEMKMEEIWGKDPNTNTEAALGKIAGGIHAVEARLKHKRQLSVSKVQPAAKVARSDTAEGRHPGRPHGRWPVPGHSDNPGFPNHSWGQRPEPTAVGGGAIMRGSEAVTSTMVANAVATRAGGEVCPAMAAAAVGWAADSTKRRPSRS
jgi:hypothetical protein